MSGIMPRLTVDPRPAGQMRYGLFNAATVRDLPDHGAAGGIEFEAATCGTTHLYTAACPITAQAVKTTTDTSPLVQSLPFIVYADLTCSPVGRTVVTAVERVRMRLLAGEQTSAEMALWNGGGVGAAPALTTIGAPDITATAGTSFAARLGALEAAFYAAYGYNGVIHVNTQAIGAASANHTVREVGSASVGMPVPQLLTTNLGTVWSFGAGYDVTGPAAAAPAAGHVFAFITAPVTVWRSSDVLVPDPSQTFNRTTNQMTVIAEREYTITPDCPTAFAVQLPVEA